MFALQARDVLSMRTYADAKKRYFELTPDEFGYRYLSRNKTLIIQEYQGRYQCLYNQNNCVEYYPDGRIVLNHCNWQTPSTATFIGACTGLSLHNYRDRMYVVLDRKHYLTPIVVKDGQPISPTKMTRKALDKEKANQLKRKTQPFFNKITRHAAELSPSPELRYVMLAKWPKMIAASKTWLSTNDMMRIVEAVEADDTAMMADIENALIGLSIKEYIVTKWIKGEQVEVRYWGDMKRELATMFASIRHNAYSERKYVVEEPVPLGELPKKDWS